MARTNCGTVIRRIVKVVFALYAVLTVAALLGGYVFIHRYLEGAPATLDRKGPPADSGGQPLYRLSWQGNDIEYEAKVYASQTKTVNKNNAAQFFASAQELWHIEPHKMADRYPSFRTQVKVEVPTDALYAHIFVQRKDQFAPHPNVTDPLMVHASAELAHWQPIVPTPIDSAMPFIKFESSRVLGQELVAATGVSWAIVLENHTFTKKELPFGIVLPGVEGPRKPTTYNPPLLQNMFTRNDWPTRKLSSQSPRTMDVALELQGIKLQWIKPKMVALLMLPAANNLTMTPITVPIADPANPDKKTDTVFRPVLYVGRESLVDFVSSRGLQMYLHAALVAVALYAAHLTFVYSLMGFFMGPRSRWAGLSRTSLTIQLAMHGLWTLKVAPSIGLLSAVLNPFNAVVAYYALAVFGVPGNPRKWGEYWRSRNQPQGLPSYQLLDETELDDAPLSANRSSSSSSSSSDAASLFLDNDSEQQQQQQVPATVPLKPDPTEHITNVRKSIDQIAMRWLVLSVGPTLVMTSLLTLFASKPMSLGSVLAFFVELGTVLLSVYGAVWLVPQLLVNSRARSGRLLPPAFHLSAVAIGALVFALACIMQLSSMLATPLWVCYWVAWACNLIALVQWIKYPNGSGCLLPIDTSASALTAVESLVMSPGSPPSSSLKSPTLGTSAIAYTYVCEKCGFGTELLSVYMPHTAYPCGEQPMEYAWGKL
ncbi:hypothetical protein EV175_000674 [Coemansia sp. RSA 1933]|nr:hypothetical protein EV175_000674 [Coemansia sp. RSA 1933]